MIKRCSYVAASALFGFLALTQFALAAAVTYVNTPQPEQSYTSTPSGATSADQETALVETPPTDTGKVQFMSGGVGDEGMEAIQAEQNNYNLKLMFVAAGVYLSDVNVRITGKSGEILLDTTTTGPVLLVRLPKGRYTVQAQSAKGSSLKQGVQVKDHLTSLVLRYPSSDAE